MMYVKYHSKEHFRLIDNGWRELNCIFIEGDVFIKMIQP